ncbi:hypothetical protein MMC07_002080 [Pseudocyphellaria aurata]|nr:hypothetical protein [Pseudocyphellaria aurata]
MSVHLCHNAEFVILVINEHPALDQVSTFILYRLGLSGQPVYVGLTKNPNPQISSPVPRIQDIVTNRVYQAWVIKLRIGLEEVRYVVKSSKAFADGDEEFQIWDWESLASKKPASAVTIGDETQTVDARVESLNSVSQVWHCLACLPDVSVPDVPVPDVPVPDMSVNKSNPGRVTYRILGHDERCTRKLVVAKHIETGVLFLLGISHPVYTNDDGSRNASSPALPQISEYLWKLVGLGSPKHGWYFKNVAVARNPAGRAWIGIIWQETDCEDPRTELYSYSVHCDHSLDKIHAESVVRPDSASASYDEAPASGIRGQVGKSQSYISIQGKRIASISPQIGGIHSSSPLRDLETR